MIQVFSTSITFQKVGTFDDYRKDTLRNFYESSDSDKVIFMHGSIIIIFHFFHNRVEREIKTREIKYQKVHNL